MQTRTGCLANSVEAGQIGAPGQIGDHAATRVVRRRDNRDGLLRDVNAELATACKDGRKVFLEECGRLMADVEINAVDATFLDLEVNRARDDVARRQLSALVMVRHETRAVRQFQKATFTAHRFGNQE
jgi:hypothetical protein